MDKEKLREANRLSDIITRLENLHKSLDSNISYISICGVKGAIIHDISSSREHSAIERLESGIVYAMTEAGIKYINEAIKKKQKEFDEL